MKRKKEKNLTPCEEKALVHLQALQIKEKEAKAKQRAKKRKVDTAVAGRSIALAGQNLPFQPQPIANLKNTQPFYPIQNPLPTRNEWNQLIPAAAQTAQFMLLNHAMQQQGIKKDIRRTTQTQTPTQTPPTGPKVGSGKSKKKFAQMDIEIMPDEDKISRFRRTGQYIPNAPPFGPVAPEEKLEVPKLIMSDERRARAAQLLKRSLDRGLGSYRRTNENLQRQAFRLGFDAFRNYQPPINLLSSDSLDKAAIDAFFKPPALSEEWSPFESALTNDEWSPFESALANPPEQPPLTIPQAPPPTIPRAPPLTILQAPLNEEKEAPKPILPDGAGARAAQLLKRSLARGLGSYVRAGKSLKRQAFDKLRNYQSLPRKPVTLSDLLNKEQNIQALRGQKFNVPTDEQRAMLAKEFKENLPTGQTDETIDMLLGQNMEAPANMDDIFDEFMKGVPSVESKNSPPLLEPSTPKNLQRNQADLIETEPPEEKKEIEEEKDTPRKLIKEYLKNVSQQDKQAFLQKYGYPIDLHESFVKYHQIAPVKLDLTPKEQDIFQEQYQNWKAVNIDKPPAIENMTPKTNIRKFIATAPVNTLTPPKAPVAPVSDAQKMLTPPQLNQYPSWNKYNVSTPLRQAGSAQQAIEMSNMLNNINPWVPTSSSSKLPEWWSYNHPTQVAIRAQSNATSQFFKQNESFSQKYVIPRQENTMRFNMYPLNLQKVLRTHFPFDYKMQRSVGFNENQLQAIRQAPHEDLEDTVDYFLSQNYPKQNQQVIPDAPVNEPSGMQPLEIEDNANIQVQPDNFGSGFDNPNITAEMENVGPSFTGTSLTAE